MAVLLELLQHPAGRVTASLRDAGTGAGDGGASSLSLGHRGSRDVAGKWQGSQREVAGKSEGSRREVGDHVFIRRTSEPPTFRQDSGAWEHPWLCGDIFLFSMSDSQRYTSG